MVKCNNPYVKALPPFHFAATSRAMGIGRVRSTLQQQPQLRVGHRVRIHRHYRRLADVHGHVQPDSYWRNPRMKQRFCWMIG